MTTLIVCPSPSQPDEFEYVLRPDTAASAQQGRAAAALLPRANGAGSEIVLLVPAHALSWHRVQLPPGLKSGGRHQTRLRAAIVGVLEEQLLDEADDLHLAVFPDGMGSQQVWVAVCQRRCLQLALDTLEAAQRHVARIVPECHPAVSPAGGTLWLSAQQAPALLLWSHGEGAGSLPWSPTSLALIDHDGIASHFAEPAVAALAEQAFARPVTLQTPAQRWLQAADDTEWNLAQFDLTRHGRAWLTQAWGRHWATFWRAPQWRIARWTALATLLLQLVGLQAWAWKERAVWAEQRAAMASLLRQTFPETQLVLDAPVQMARATAELRHHRGQGTGPALDDLLQVLAQHLPAGQSLQAIEFNPDMARLRGLQLNPATAKELSHQLALRGWSAQVDNDTLSLRVKKDAP